MDDGVNVPRTLACALSLAATAATMILLDVVHPPAGATTLIVSLGIITRPADLLIIECAVGMLVLEALIIHRLSGIDYPIWAARATPTQENRR
jgi:CBS-domain-containing membrane protein